MKKLTCIFFTAILFISAGCKKSFFDINENPNSPVEKDVDPKLILPSALNRAANKMAVSYANYAGWLGYWSRSGTYGPSSEEESFNITTGFEADEWNWFDILYDFDTMEKKATAANQGMYVAIAKIMKTVGFMYLVDQYNNVPYTEAFQLVEHPTPAYDKGDFIYADLFKQLDAAVALLEAADLDANPGIEDADVVFNGDAASWLKFANTQRLKLLIHTSEVTSDAAAKAELAKVTPEGFFSQSGNFSGGDLGDGAYVRLTYTQGQNKQNPFWNTYEELYTGDVANQYWRANNYLLNQVYRWQSATAWDTRFLYVFDEADSPLGGNIYYGYNYGEVIPNDDPFKAVNSSNVAGPGLAYSASQPQWLFTAVESLFLQAEATQRGWLAGNAQDVYNEAVLASFEWLGAGAGEGQDYLDNDALAAWTPTVNKIRLINFQKYIALAGINNFEAYVDYRRLDGEEAILNDKATDDLPALPASLAPSRGSNQIPLRLIYPQSEYNYNAANVGAQGNIKPQSDRVFWDKGAR
ncbi:SusD/RagB family nutrient-binding outer membrane lipoprotein [Mucilaginibacter limnophilus]|uniref:SusD/RagB family nutrient-binding outer membrane lipoprotein n=1 Tax=Mucilaginibacter limnophilus TaxID=1932778 RepID=A0A3S2Y3W7_9SPHI|nr:SusD/RagB family nutrient-binding outer membrane lipoprotein [Mucilaginibacter limnophilus]RVU01380.1 SusD/RagB family nutrient-binding outer membrane lipoprotein [Mucilaginibacter limnophilus]